MNEEFYIKALIEELSGQLSDEDQIRLDQWRSSDPESISIEKTIRNLWQLSDGYKHDLIIDEKHDWKNLQSKINVAKTRSIATIWYRIAAILVLSVSISILIYQKNSLIHFKSTIDNEEFVLSDGTIVSLSKGSTISYPKKFDNERRVEVSGQALMRVAKNKNKTFVLTTPDMEIQVLGTTFFISDFEHDEIGEIQLIEGKISLKTNKDKDKSIVLTEGQRLSIDASGTSLTESLNTQIYHWYPPDFDFKNVPLSDVIEKISDFYGIIISIDDDLRQCMFTGNLNKLEAEDMLNSISKVYSAQLKKGNASYMIVGGSCQ